MKPSQIKNALKTCLDAGRPAFMWGPPGVGKSDVCRQVAQERTEDLIDVRAVLLDPVDLRGLPRINGDGKAHWCPPDFLPREGKGILFLDEVNAAPPLVQAGCYQLVLDRRLGEYTLPPGWNVLAAGNRETDRAVTSRMPSALANRFVHLHFDVDLDDWVKWALQAGLVTPVIAFLRYRPALLHSFDPQKNEKAFPTPRSWEFVSNLFKTKPAPEIEFDLFAGTVGEGAAAEFLGFVRIFRKLPNPDKVLMDPDNAPVPDDPATLYALVGALARKASEQTMDRLVKYAGRISPEFSVLLIKDCAAHDENIVNTRAFIQWASDHQEVIF